MDFLKKGKCTSFVTYSSSSPLVILVMQSVLPPSVYRI